MTEPKFSQRERIAVIFSVFVIGLILLVTLYVATIDKGTINKMLGRVDSSSSSSSLISSNSNSEINSLIASCTDEKIIKDFVPDQFYIDKYKDNGNKVAVMSQAFTDLSIKITADQAKAKEEQNAKLNPSNYTQFDFYFGSINANSSTEIYNRSRLELNNLMEVKVPEAKTMTFRNFVFEYYCGQLKAYKILTANSKFAYNPGYLEFKTSQLNDLQPLGADEFEKRVYTQARNNFGPEINFSKLYEQYKNVANLY